MRAATSIAVCVFSTHIVRVRYYKRQMSMKGKTCPYGADRQDTESSRCSAVHIEYEPSRPAERALEQETRKPGFVSKIEHDLDVAQTMHSK